MVALDKSMHLAQGDTARNRPMTMEAWYMAGVVVLLAMLAAVCLYGALEYLGRYPLHEITQMETTDAH